MRKQLLAAFAWLCFVLVVATGGYLALAACDLGLHPIFGLAYCGAAAEPDRLATERERVRDLRARIHEVELRAARLPACAPRLVEAEPKPPEPPRIEPKPEPLPEPKPPEPPRPEPARPEPPDDQLVVPEKLADLKGCWQSVRGDLQMYSDDGAERPVGTVRVCYCFNNKGGGTVRYNWTHGTRCTASLKAKLTPGRLSFSHGRIPCNGRPGYVIAADIVCQSDAAGAAATCDRQNRGRFLRGETIGENYRRVSDDYCR